MAGLRVAFVGKGGVGKSVIAGTFARLLARAGDPVLAVDSDPMPGLAFSLGLPSTDAPLPDEAVVEAAEGEEGPRFRLALPAEEAVERYATVAPDGVRFLQFGKLRGGAGPVIRSQHGFRQIIDDLPGDRWGVVGDLPGGTRQPFFGWSEFAAVVVVVVEASAASLLTGRRLARLAHAERGPERIVAVATKVRHHGDVEVVERRTSLPVVAAVPWDAEVVDADRQGRSVLDRAPAGPTVTAVASLVRRLTEEAP